MYLLATSDVQFLRGGPKVLPLFFWGGVGPAVYAKEIFYLLPTLTCCVSCFCFGLPYYWFFMAYRTFASASVYSNARLYTVQLCGASTFAFEFLQINRYAKWSGTRNMFLFRVVWQEFFYACLRRITENENDCRVYCATGNENETCGFCYSFSIISSATYSPSSASPPRQSASDALNDLPPNCIKENLPF